MKKRYYAAVLLGISLSLSGAAGSFADQAAAQECVDVTVEEEATGCGETEQEETRDTSDKTNEQTIVPDAEEQNAAAATEEQNAAAVAEEQNTAPDAEEQNTAPDAEEQNAAAATEEQNTAPATEEQNAAAATEEQNTTSETKEQQTAANRNFLGIVSAVAQKNNDGTYTVTIETSTADYTRLYFGTEEDPDDFREEDIVEGSASERGGRIFAFDLTYEPAGQIISCVPCRADGTWYLEEELYMKLPVLGEEQEQEDTGTETVSEESGSSTSGKSDSASSGESESSASSEKSESSTSSEKSKSSSSTGKSGSSISGKSGSSSSRKSGSSSSRKSGGSSSGKSASGAGASKSGHSSGDTASDKTDTQGSKSKDKKTGSADMDISEAPAIEGLTCEAAVQNEKASLFRIYEYSEGYKLLEIVLSTGEAGSNTSERKTEADSSVLKSKPETGSTPSDSSSGRSKKGSQSSSEDTAEEILQYLLVPEGATVPENLDDDMIAIQLPAAHVCTIEEDLSERLAGYGIDTESTVSSQNGVYVRSYGASGVPESADEILQGMRMFGIPTLIDRSADEADEEAAAEWETVYRLFTET